MVGHTAKSHKKTRLKQSQNHNDFHHPKEKIAQLNKDNKWKEIEFFKSDYIASKDVNAWLGLYEVIK